MGRAPFPVTVHPYKAHYPGATAYERGSSTAANALVCIGGLGDGPHSIAHVGKIAERLEEAADLDYSLFEVRLRSSFSGFGTSSLAEDVEDISALVEYLRGIGKKKIILHGHSTGCQDCIEYANYDKHKNSVVDGFILQAPVSDREALESVFPDHEKSIEVADKMIAEGRQDDCMPNALVPSVLGGAPISAYRLRSLCVKGGDDDYFSSDLDDETVSKFWARFDKPVLVLHSEKDEFVPPHVDQVALRKKYQAASSHVSPLSDLIPGAGHVVHGAKAQEWLADRVAKFLAEV